MVIDEIRMMGGGWEGELLLLEPRADEFVVGRWELVFGEEGFFEEVAGADHWSILNIIV